MKSSIHRRADRRRQAGFSLIEVVFAIAVLAGVLLSIASLIYIGSRHVSSGRNGAQALAAARDVMEELKELGFHQTYELLGHDGTQPVYVLDTSTVDSGGSVPAIAEAWHRDLKLSLKTSRIEIRFESIVETGTAPALQDAEAIRIVVTVRWQEYLRNRQVRLSTVRT